MKRFVLIVVATILCAFNTNAQNLRRVEGSVKDYRGASISNATLHINGLDKTFMTQADGSFVIDVPIHCYAITVRADGYRTKYMEIDGTYMLFILRPEKQKEVAKAEEQARIVAEREAKARQYTRASKGYDQYINLSYGYNRVSDFIGLNYIGGYRFNHLFFLGIGTGVDFALFTPIMEEKFANCMPTRVNIPVYFNFRTNFLNKAWSPYISVSAGARISPAIQEAEGYTYNQSGLLGDISFGVERRLGEKSSLYLGVGYRIESFIGAVPMYNLWGKEDFKFTTGASHGFNVHIGISF